MTAAPIVSLLQSASLEISVAHRGASEQAPENTMAAFELAAAMVNDLTLLG